MPLTVDRVESPARNDNTSSALSSNMRTVISNLVSKYQAVEVNDADGRSKKSERIKKERTSAVTAVVEENYDFLAQIFAERIRNRNLQGDKTRAKQYLTQVFYDFISTLERGEITDNRVWGAIGITRPATSAADGSIKWVSPPPAKEEEDLFFMQRLFLGFHQGKVKQDNVNVLKMAKAGNGLVAEMSYLRAQDLRAASESLTAKNTKRLSEIPYDRFKKAFRSVLKHIPKLSNKEYSGDLDEEELRALFGRDSVSGGDPAKDRAFAAFLRMIEEDDVMFQEIKVGQPTPEFVQEGQQSHLLETLDAKIGMRIEADSRAAGKIVKGIASRAVEQRNNFNKKYFTALRDVKETSSDGKLTTRSTLTFANSFVDLLENNQSDGDPSVGRPFGGKKAIRSSAHGFDISVYDTKAKFEEDFNDFNPSHMPKGLSFGIAPCLVEGKAITVIYGNDGATPFKAKVFGAGFVKQIQEQCKSDYEKIAHHLAYEKMMNYAIELAIVAIRDRAVQLAGQYNRSLAAENGQFTFAEIYSGKAGGSNLAKAARQEILDQPEVQAEILEIKQAREWAEAQMKFLHSVRLTEANMQTPDEVARKMERLQGAFKGQGKFLEFDASGEKFTAANPAIAVMQKAGYGNFVAEVNSSYAKVKSGKVQPKTAKVASELAKIYSQKTVADSFEKTSNQLTTTLSLNPREDMAKMLDKYQTRGKGLNKEEKAAFERLLFDTPFKVPSAGDSVVIKGYNASEFPGLARRNTDDRRTLVQVLFKGEPQDVESDIAWVDAGGGCFAKVIRCRSGGNEISEYYDKDGKKAQVRGTVEAGQVVICDCPFKRVADGRGGFKYFPIPRSELKGDLEARFKGLTVDAASVDGNGEVMGRAFLFDGRSLSPDIEMGLKFTKKVRNFSRSGMTNPYDERSVVKAVFYADKEGKITEGNGESVIAPDELKKFVPQDFRSSGFNANKTIIQISNNPPVFLPVYAMQSTSSVDNTVHYFYGSPQTRKVSIHGDVTYEDLQKDSAKAAMELMNKRKIGISIERGDRAPATLVELVVGRDHRFSSAREVSFRDKEDNRTLAKLGFPSATCIPTDAQILAGEPKAKTHSNAKPGVVAGH